MNLFSLAGRDGSPHMFETECLHLRTRSLCNHTCTWQTDNQIKYRDQFIFRQYKELSTQPTASHFRKCSSEKLTYNYNSLLSSTQLMFSSPILLSESLSCGVSHFSFDVSLRLIQFTRFAQSLRVSQTWCDSATRNERFARAATIKEAAELRGLFPIRISAGSSLM